MSNPMILLVVLGAVLAIPLGVIVLLYVIVPAFKALGWLLRQIGRFLISEVGDALRLVGGLLTTIVFVPLVLATVVIGRWSAAAHYGRAVQGELATMGGCLYRLIVGNPARLLCLTALTDGIERRIPQAVAEAPGADRPSARVGQFEGYTIVGSLAVGGSGGRLYVARPDAIKAATFERQGHGDVEQVVIKAFSLKDGSSLPQIVRESRALDAAKKLGLVLDHELTNERFFYVMRYVPGESLGLVTQRLHAMSGGDGLAGAHLRQALGYGADLLRTLDTYHRGGLWHKDVKPDNIIVDGKAAHLVDLGLVTPLRSAMTLTTHGTEYFRDPEMVRLALKGVKVHQVDGAKFDIYAAGAVLFSMIENSFPAHGGLSQITRRCPEALRWIVRRAMTEYDRRYPSAAAMLADLEAVLHAPDPFAVRPADLPSMRDGADAAAVMPEEPAFVPGPAPARDDVFAGVRAAHTPAAPPASVGADAASRPRPRIRVTSWWTGRYAVDGRDAARARVAAAPAEVAVGAAAIGLGGPAFGVAAPARPAWRARGPKRSAAEQLDAARDRVQRARQRARARMSSRRVVTRGRNFRAGPNLGVGLAVVLGVGGVALAVFAVTANRAISRPPRVVIAPDLDPRLPDVPAVPEPDAAIATIARASAVDGPDTSADAPSAPAKHDLSDDQRAQVQRVIDEFERTRRWALDEIRAITGGIAGGQSDAPAPPDTPSPTVADPLATVLIVSDVLPPLAPAAAESIRAMTDALRQAGFEVIGSLQPAPDDDSARTQDNLIAEARLARGQIPLATAEAGRALTAWLDSRTDADAVVWISPGEPGSGDRPRYWVVGPVARAGAERAVEHRARTQVLRRIVVDAAAR